MNRLLVLLLTCAAAIVPARSDEDCVGRHHERCPMLVTREESRDEPNCSKSSGSDGWTLATFAGRLLTQSADENRAVRRPRFLRECLDRSGTVVRSCPVEIKVHRNGSFRRDISLKSADESICVGGVRTDRDYEEQVRIRIEADGCDDLVVDYGGWWKPRDLIMVCRADR